MFGTRKLGRTSDQRKAMLRAMTTYLFENGKVETTFYRAKEVQPVAERMITLAKKKDLASYRKATPASPVPAPAAAMPPRWPLLSWCNKNPSRTIKRERTPKPGVRSYCYDGGSNQQKSSEKARGSYFTNSLRNWAKRGRPLTLTMPVSPWMRGRQ